MGDTRIGGHSRRPVRQVEEEQVDTELQPDAVYPDDGPEERSSTGNMFLDRLQDVMDRGPGPSGRRAERRIGADYREAEKQVFEEAYVGRMSWKASGRIRHDLFNERCKAELLVRRDRAIASGRPSTAVHFDYLAAARDYDHAARRGDISFAEARQRRSELYVEKNRAQRALKRMADED